MADRGTAKMQTPAPAETFKATTWSVVPRTVAAWSGMKTQVLGSGGSSGGAAVPTTGQLFPR